MIAALILGMGLPTVIIYIMLSVLVAPSLIKIGALPMAAHMFVFYFGVLAFVTPPVCVAAFAAAGIAGSNPMATGFMATRLGIAGFIVPFMFIYGPQLLFIGKIHEIIWSLTSAVLGILSLAGGVQGWLIGKTRIVERILLLGAGLLLIKPGIYTDMIGFLCLGIVVLLQILEKNKVGRRDRIWEKSGFSGES
jgi:TRAP-type uncharacterized transport system fused permease subunit